MAEFDFGDCGTIILKEQNIYHTIPFKITRWIFTGKKGFIFFKGNETHMETVKRFYKILIDIKLVSNVTILKSF
jgi:hypothetical protein